MRGENNSIDIKCFNNLLNETTISSFNIEVGFNAIVLSFFECNAGARGFRMKAEIE